MKTLLFFLLMTLSTFAQIQKVEPPFWWENMEHSQVQIMFYGKNIAQHNVTVSNGISIKAVEKTENPNYLFITIDTKNVAAQDFTFNFSTPNNSKLSFSHKYSIKKRKENSKNRESFSSKDVVYLLMPDRFSNGNTKNDSDSNLNEKLNRDLPGGRHGGDLQGIINQLDYIKALGATAIWSTPLCEDNDKAYSYHGYAQSDVYKIDPRYGSNEDYVRLSSEAKKRGIKIVMDYVTNHWGAQHWMFKDLPSYQWFHQFPGYSQTNYRMTTQFDSNASKIDKKQCTDGWFVESMPDLNQSNPLVLNYLIQNAIWWIEFADLDGFRVDTYSYCDKEGIAKWTKAITNEYPNFNIVGEVWYYNSAHIAYWQKNSKLSAIQNYNSYLPSVMDFTLQEIILNGVFNEDKQEWNNGMVRIYQNFCNDFIYPDINNILVFFENHDTTRLNQVYQGDLNKYKMAVSLMATIRGIPQIYYGSEIGIQGDKNKGDADIRRDFPGGWATDSQNAFVANQRTETQKQYFDFTSKLFNWRKNKTVIHNGKTTQYVPENNVYVYFRYDDNETVMVIINNSNETQNIKTSRFAENIKNYELGKDVLSNKSYNLTNNIEVEGKSVLILELK